MKKKRPLTLLEVAIGMFLVGILLTGLFHFFYQGTKKNIVIREVKQKILQIELFQQKVKNLLHRTKKVWIDSHPAAIGKALFISFEEAADPDPTLSGTLEGMVYLDENNRLHFVSWPEKTTGRIETLLDKVKAIKIELFDPKKGIWLETWSPKKEEKPAMLSLTLTRDKQEKIPFVFFLSSEHIMYKDSM